MEYVPNYPEDQELKNIIDKLAMFVARNGYEFEQMTKQKQKDNPRFSFLFGGEYYNYYQYKVNAEKTFLRYGSHNDQSNPQNLNPNIPMLFPPQQHNQFNNPQQQQNSIANVSQVAAVCAAVAVATAQQQQKTQNQINEFQDQIRQSLDNLNAQHQMLNNQQQLLIDEAISKMQDEKLCKLAHDYNISLQEFELILHPIFDTCTKDSISSGKNWISTKCHLPVHYEIICNYFLKRIKSTLMPFEHKLHLLYLINDLFNHCSRKSIESLKQSLTDVVIPVYCSTFLESEDENGRERLIKLVKLWETNQYLNSTIIEQLKNPQIALSNYKQSLCNEYSNLVQPITSATMAKFNQLQQQHNEFVNHQNSKIQQLQISTSLPTSLPNLSNVINSVPTSLPQFLTSTHSTLPFNQPPPSTSSAIFPPMLHHQANQILNAAPNVANLPPPSIPPHQHLQFTQAPQQQNLPNSQIFSQPPQQQQQNNQLQAMNNPHIIQQQPPPSVKQQDVPYYELPAGLMVSLVKLEDDGYEELDPSLLKLPLPAPPNERLIRSVEAFYSAPAHDRPRNDDGWEQLGLYEWFRAKTEAKKSLEERLEKEKELYRKRDDDHKDYRRDRSYKKSYNSSKSRSNSRSPRRRSRHRDSRSSDRSKSDRSRRSFSSNSSSSNSSDMYTRRSGKYKRSISSSSRSSTSRERNYKRSRSRSSSRKRRSYSPKNRSR